MELAQSSSTAIAYDINNLLVSTFKDNNITIYGTWEEPLFKAKDIGDLLGLEQIRKSIQNLDVSMKVMEPGNTITGLKEQWFLTEEGLYELLYISRKPMSKGFCH
jgi:prophage antirepressor-like protein